MIDETSVGIAVAVAVLLSPLPFLLAIGAAIFVRARTSRVPLVLRSIVSFAAGLALGTMTLAASEPWLLVPILGFPLLLLVSLWRSRRRVEAGWVLAGVSLPWTVLWGFYGAALLAGTPFDPAQTFGSLALGAIPFVAGVGLGIRGDPPPATPAIDASAGQPGSRVIGSIAAAIRQPTLIGPFGQPHIAMLVAVVLAFLIVPLLIPGDVPIVARVAIVALVAALVGAEAFVRSFPDRSRRAFEAFSWLGEWELARARAIAGGVIPTSTSAAEAWLRDRPEREEEIPLRIEVLVFAGRIEEARSLVANLPAATPALDFERAALADLVDFRGGGDSNLEAMERAATKILPEDGDDRLRAEVSVAVAHVRRRMADPAPEAADAIEPLLEVRRRLGRRADGQVGRAFRRRLIPILFLVGLVGGLGLEVLGAPPLP